MSQKNVRHFINNRTKAYCLIFKISLISNNAQPDSDFETEADVTLNDFLRRSATMRCCHKNRCSVKCHCERFSSYPEKRQHVAYFWLELENSQRCGQNFVKSTSLRNGVLHWNDFERNIVANRIIEIRWLWHYLKIIESCWLFSPGETYLVLSECRKCETCFVLHYCQFLVSRRSVNFKI